MKKIYIDGQAGTTGLRIRERLAERDDVTVLTLPEDKRKDPDERKKFINASDFTFLCLPDAASIEAVSMVENPNVRIIDASTAHRTNPQWAYGFPELSREFRNKIKNSKRVAVPGCYASGFNSIVYPLVKEGIFAPYQYVTSYAVSGYSGAGKKGIAQYEDENRTKEFDTPRQYALTQSHKHLPEMQAVPGIAAPPIFMPVVADFYSGMEVTAKTHNNYVYEFAPITFLNFNAKDEYEYSDGIKPQVDFDEILKSEKDQNLNFSLRLFPSPEAPWGNTTEDMALFETILRINGKSLFGGNAATTALWQKGATTRANTAMPIVGKEQMPRIFTSWKKSGACILQQERPQTEVSGQEN